MSTRQGTKIGNQDANLEQRVQRLEEMLRKVLARPRGPAPVELLTKRIAQTAHGFTVGHIVQPGSDGTWGLAIAQPQECEADRTIGNRKNPALAVVTEVLSDDAFLVSFGGFLPFVPAREQADAEDADDALVGRVYSLSETEAGRMTARTTSTGIRVFSTTSIGDGIFMPYRDRDQVIAEWVGSTAVVGQVINVINGDLADAAALTNPYAQKLGLVIAVKDDQVLACVSGICTLPSTASPGVGLCYLDAESAGTLTLTKPETPEDQRPVLVGYSYDDGTFWMNPPPDRMPGIGDLWDVDHSTPPEDHQVLVWDDTAKRYIPGLIGTDSIEEGSIAGAQLADFLGYAILGNPAAATASAQQLIAGTDGDVLRRVGTALGFGKIVTINIGDQAVTAAKLVNANAHTVVGNGTNTAASPTGITASANGQVLNRKSNTTAFTAAAELGTSASGGGSLAVYSTSSISVVVSASGVVTVTFGASKTITLDPSHLTGTYDIRFRELDYCNGGVAQKRWVLCDAGH